LKSAHSLKPVRSGNPERASLTERRDSKTAECSLFGLESLHTAPHFTFNAPPLAVILKEIFKIYFTTVKL
jgi:hypothetical protein